MKPSERTTYLRHYHAELHIELDQTHYGTASEGLGSAHVEENDRAQRSWAFAIAMLLIAAASMRQEA